MPTTTTAPPRAPRGTSNGKTPAPAEPYAATVRIEDIDVADNVRDDSGELDELVASIKQHGILEPIRVRATSDGRAVVVFGHRRLAAAKLADLEEVLAIVDTGEQTQAERTVQQLVENIQRRDLNALEEAKALRGILEAEAGLTQDQLAERVGRGRSTVTNLLRILDTDPAVQEHVAAGRLSAAHAKALAGLPVRQQVEWAQQSIERGYSAHQIEQSIERDREWKQRQAAESRETSATRDERVARAIEKLPDKAAPIVIARGYYSGDQTDPILRRFKKAGYTKVSVGDVRPRSDTLGCDCGVTMIEVGYGGGVTVKPGCVEQKHRDVKWKADMAASERQRTAEERIRKTIAEHVRVALLTIDPTAARVLLWAVMDWSLNDWVKEHKGDWKKPDAWAELNELGPNELAAEIARFASKGFGDRYGVKLDWPAIAEAFGVSLEPPAKPKAKGGKKAANG